MSKPLVIVGTGDYARIAHHYLERDSPQRVAAFTVHREYLTQETLLGVPVVPFETLVETHGPEEHSMLVATGFSKVNRVRTGLYEEGKRLGYEFVSYVSSRAIDLGSVEIGENTFVFELNNLQPNVRIGNNCVLWSGNHIGHDAVIGDHCFLASHVVVSGNVTIGEACFIGVNATIRDGVTIAPRCVIGAGALVMKDTEEGDVLSVRGTQALDVRSWDLKNF